MLIEIDIHSGFCFGVQKAIDKAEDTLNKGEKLYCLGEIVHNGIEVTRLTQMGMKTIHPEEIESVKNKTILLRSHGEPPSSYYILNANKNKVIDATCPVVLKLQQRVKMSFTKLQETKGQLIIFGKQGHPEVIGLNGQINNKAIIVSNIADLSKINFNLPIELYSQTTMPLDIFQLIKMELENKAKNTLVIHDTICRQVANRVPHLKKFSQKHDMILFVSGKKSSNGKLLFEVCKKQNANSYFVSSPNEIEATWFSANKSIGICGATSTPKWLLEKVKDKVTAILNID